MSYPVSARPRPRALLARALAFSALLLAALAATPAAHAERATLSSGAGQTCVVTTSAGVSCWGAGVPQSGAQPPAGTYTPEPAGVPAAAPAKSIESGDQAYQCAVRTNGAIGCWGWASYFDQDYWPVRQVAPVALVTTAGTSPATITDFVDVAVNDREGCGVQASGRVRCWQASSTAASDEISGITDATSITSAGEAFCARRATGGAACWDRGLTRTTGIMNGPVAVWTKGATATNVPDVSEAVSVSGTCALLDNGVVTCWTIAHRPQKNEEYLTFGGLDDQPSMGTVVDFARSFAHSCAVISDGKVKCYGDNATGQLGVTGVTSSRTPVTVAGLPAATDVSVGAGYSCARLVDTTVRCWGAGSFLGNASAASGFTSTPVTPAGDLRVAASTEPRPVDPARPSAPIAPPFGPSYGDVTPSSIVVRWFPPKYIPTVGIARYRVTLGGTTITVPDPQIETQFTGLSPDTAYAASVVAVDNAGKASDALTLDYRTTKALTLGPPELEQAFTSATTIRLSWLPTGGLRPNQYRLEVAGRTIYVPTGNDRVVYVVTDLQPDTDYPVVVTALDGEGQQSASSTATYRTSSATPTPIPATPTPTPTTTPAPWENEPYTGSYAVTGTTTITSLSRTAMPLTGSATLRAFQDQFASGTVALNDTQGRGTALGFIPVTTTIGFVASGDGTASSGRPQTLTIRVRVKVRSVKAFGAIPLAGGNTCQTKELTTLALAGQGGFTPRTGGDLAATYAISNLNGCGLFEGLVNPLVASTGNTMRLTLTRN